jgi:undecaprenyl-phosphate 4-deoxy-4-formamido-L-arabinose transferase
MCNYGQHNALLCGIRTANHDVIVTLDDDLQHPPEEISKLLSRLKEGCDLVYGVPEKKAHGWWRGWSTHIIKWVLCFVVGKRLARGVSAFRVFKKYIRNAFADYNGAFVSIDVLLSWGTNASAVVPVVHHPRHSGHSHYGIKRLVKHTLNLVTGFSIWPLRLASFIGFGLTLFGIGFLIFGILRQLYEGGRVTDFQLLTFLVSIFAGAQLFALGIMGEYLACIHFRNMGKPAYVVREQTGSGKENHKRESGLRLSKLGL